MLLFIFLSHQGVGKNLIQHSKSAYLFTVEVQIDSACAGSYRSQKVSTDYKWNCYQ